MGRIAVAVAREGLVTRLSKVTCTLGRADRPYPEIHERDAWTIALVRRGRFRYRGSASNHRHAVREGWLLFGAPGAEFECAHDHDGGDECASLSVPVRVMRDVAGVARLPEKKLRATSPVLPPLPKVSALLERAIHRDLGDLDEIGYLVAERLAGHASDASDGGVSNGDRHAGHADRVQHAIARIEASCREPLPLADLANSVGLSPYHFLRVFRARTGTTPHQYLIGARLRLAVKLLLDTQRSVTEIGYDVGFQDLSNFANTFRRVVGCSPRAYRAG
jgi:AraC family transcriptional regulator